jgi:hypothetical protein
MALDALWAVLNLEVSGVSGVQAPIQEGLRDTPAPAPEVSEVSGIPGNHAELVETCGTETSDTPLENVRYQSEPAWPLGCTLDTPGNPEKIEIEVHSSNTQPDPTPVIPKRLFRQRGPWLTAREHLSAQACNAHHFHCRQCIAAGQGIAYGRRCHVGLALWHAYIGADHLMQGSWSQNQ